MFQSLLDDEEYLDYLSVNIPKWNQRRKKNFQINVVFGTGLNTTFECTLSGTLKKKLNREMTKKGDSKGI